MTGSGGQPGRAEAMLDRIDEHAALIRAIMAIADGSSGVTVASQVRRAGSWSIADANVVVIHAVSLSLDCE